MANNTIATRVPEDLQSRLEAIALISGQNMGSLVREALEQYVRLTWTQERVDAALQENRERQRRQADAISQAAASLAPEPVPAEGP